MNLTDPALLPILLSLLIPIVAIIMGLGIAALALVLNFRKRRHSLELYHKERLAALDKGLELPPLPEAFFVEQTRSPSPHGALLKGLIFSLTGSAVFLALREYQPEAARWALIPIFLGLAFLIYYFAVGRKEAANRDAERKTQVPSQPNPVGAS
jgi:hypothetical protein